MTLDILQALRKELIATFHCCSKFLGFHLLGGLIQLYPC